MIIVGRYEGCDQEPWWVQTMETIDVVKEFGQGLERFDRGSMARTTDGQIASKEPFEFGLALKDILSRKGYRGNPEFFIHFYQIRQFSLALRKLH